MSRREEIRVTRLLASDLEQFLAHLSENPNGAQAGKQYRCRPRRVQQNVGSKHGALRQGKLLAREKLHSRQSQQI